MRMFIAIALVPFYVWFVLWLTRPIVRFAWNKLPNGIIRRILFFSWKV